ncbi:MULTISPECIES: sensor histidine kinase [unclassified Oleiphilus]|uniref:sensor histidine kinase n=1 Tax=unclassified Oleiphilus TaxID=2631174 RepID=UPI0009EEBC2C|nr:MULTISPECIES: ATP-binding protein [unclassified Oleiphilus]
MFSRTYTDKSKDRSIAPLLIIVSVISLFSALTIVLFYYLMPPTSVGLLVGLIIVSTSCIGATALSVKKSQNSQIASITEDNDNLTDEKTALIRKLKAIESELSQKRDALILTEKMASLGQMSAGIAHEINNPVGFMMSNLCTLKEYIFFLDQLTKQLLDLMGSLSKSEKLNHEEILVSIEKTLKIEDLDFVLSDANSLVDESITGGTRIKEITNSMKGYVRETTEESVVLVNDLIEQTLNIVWNQIKYSCTLEKQLNHCDQVKLSPSAFNQVLLNIMVNASHAMDGKAGTLRITTFNDNNMVITEIADSGCGISKGNIKKIFDPFFTTKPVGQGTGLGMSISYEIIKGFGGKIDVSSEVDVGTTFRISLPKYVSED